MVVNGIMANINLKYVSLHYKMKRILPFRSLICFVTMFVLCANLLLATDYELNFDNISLDQGLSQTMVTAMAQDKKGFVWFGTEDGLNRFDGYKFKVFQSDTKDPNSLSHSSVWSLLVDANDGLWIGTYEGLSKYNPQKETFVNYKNDPEDPSSLGNNHVRTLFEGSDGVLWVGTIGGGLNKFDSETGKFIKYLNNPDDENSISGNSIQSIIDDGNGMYWIGTNKGLDRFDPVAEKFYRTPILDDQVQFGIGSVYLDSYKSLWVSVAQLGLLEFSQSMELINRYEHDPKNNKSISNNSITAIFEDSYKQLWIGTDGGGLNHLDRVTGVFTHNKPDRQNPYSLDWYTQSWN